MSEELIGSILTGKVTFELGMIGVGVEDGGYGGAQSQRFIRFPFESVALVDRRRFRIMSITCIQRRKEKNSFKIPLTAMKTEII